MARKLKRRRASRSGAAAVAPPSAAIVAVGDELLAGRTLDTNSPWLAARLTELGFRVRRALVAGDEPRALREALAVAARGARLVIVTGGLGPTRDDRTFEALGRLVGSPLAPRAEVIEALTRRHERFGTSMPASDRRQARIPVVARVLPNRFGTAPGIWIEWRGVLVCALPGVPGEMKGLFGEELAPLLVQRFTALAPAAAVQIRTVGLPEAEIADRVERLRPIPGRLDAYRVTTRGVDVRVHQPVGRARESRRWARRLAASLGAHVYEVGERSLAEVVVDALRATGASLAVAESCTGGLLGATVTSVSGASDVFWGGWITYSNAAKVRQLGVTRRVLATHGAVSIPVARAMAAGARRNAGASWGIGITGIAGPGGGSPTKPVGTVAIAWAGPGRAGRVELDRFDGDRVRIRELAVTRALDGLRRALLGLPWDGEEPRRG
ncbi:MAG: CinA family nicotinamide mononucleotide deamidase-related protein [bacterium]